MDFSLPYFSYCENALWLLDQPVNVLSSTFYWLIAGWLVLRPQDSEETEFHQITAVLVFIMGMASFYWHVTGESVGLALDIATSMLVAAVLVTVLCYKLLEWSPVQSMITIVIMFLLCVLLKDAGIPYLIQNGGAFLPPLFFLAISSLIIQEKNKEGMVLLLCSAYSLFFGVFCRSIDMVVCNSFPVGTHFLSHIFMCVSIIYIVKALDTAGHRPENVKIDDEEKEASDSDIV
jgi:hypothetical protein